MNILFNFFIACGLSIFVLACTDSSNRAEKELITIDTVLSVDSVKKEVLLKNEDLQLVYEQYLVLSKYLVVEDYIAAKEVVVLLNSIAKQNLVSKKVLNAVNLMLVSSDISSLRTAFSDFSNVLISEIKSTGLQSGALFLAHCPMAENDKGAYWLTSKKEVLNPYYGDEMLNCGEVNDF